MSSVWGDRGVKKPVVPKKCFTIQSKTLIDTSPKNNAVSSQHQMMMPSNASQQDDYLLTQLRSQVEFYFSDHNLSSRYLSSVAIFELLRSSRIGSYG